MKMRTRVRRVALFLSILVVPACGGGSSSVVPGKACTVDSECASGQACSFGFCMAPCQEVKDCPSGQQCVRNSLGVKVCLLPSAEACIATSQCAPPLVCGFDGKCHNGCLADTDCATATAKCLLPEGVCAEPSASTLRAPNPSPSTDASPGQATVCTARDGFCPSGCNATTDPDCVPLCGNSVVELGETCDPPSSCVTGCNDDNACTIDLLTGSAATCNVACTHVNIAVCAGGDGCCPPGCNANSDSDCSAHCGDSFVEPKETCDPPSSCPAACNDANACTVDVLTGSAANCNAACLHTPITTCTSGDGCCPAVCNAVNDKDCPAVCGNNLVEPGETCDPPSACAASCNDGNTCTVDTLTGNPASCNVACAHTPIVVCKSGDGCCPAGCNSTNDSDCSTSCGNKVKESNETCDPPDTCPANCNDGDACTIDIMTGSSLNCNVACTRVKITSCVAGDGCCPAGCSAQNDADCPVQCGNNVVEPGETCDPPSSCPTTCDDADPCTSDAPGGSAANCTAVCTHTPVITCGASDRCCPTGCNNNTDQDCPVLCGNGTLETGETCDPPNSCPSSCNDNDACTLDLLVGSRTRCTAECTHRNITACTNGDQCCPKGCNERNDSDCPSVCGNGVKETGEECDPQWTCPSTCDDGNACTNDTLTGTPEECSVRCSHSAITICTNGDGCCDRTRCNANNDTDCTPVCGNGVVEGPQETCDPPSTCRTTCDDSTACTTDQMTGSSATCNVRCVNTPITTCTSGDGCCDRNWCNALNDTDCPSVCGNGIVEPHETCDPISSCPSDCDDHDPCTVDTLEGDRAKCTAVCVHRPITTCTNGDGCCLSTCNKNNDSDCKPICGNGVIEPGETCDPISSCPTDVSKCDDRNVCTNDTFSGDAKHCTALCSHVYKPGCTCTTYYADSDGDGFGNLNITKCTKSSSPGDGYSRNSDDCCDTDKDANPAQTRYFQTQTGCGGYDFDCNEVLELQWQDVVSNECGTCSYDALPANAWCQDEPPGCGAHGMQFVSCGSSVDGGPECPVCHDAVQGCR